jgi:hypothetical protein
MTMRRRHNMRMRVTAVNGRKGKERGAEGRTEGREEGKEEERRKGVDGEPARKQRRRQRQGKCRAWVGISPPVGRAWCRRGGGTILPPSTTRERAEATIRRLSAFM